MRSLAIFLTFTLVIGSTFAQKLKPQTPPITEFEVGRHTFFDFGPPFDFYEILVVKASGSDTNVERIIVTPEIDACFQPAKVEAASAVIHKPVSDLLGADPCAIPEKELKRELRRCKHCLVFSGANVTMRVQCSNGPRIIRADILDRDMFDPNPHTPAQTSWTMRLLTSLDSALGPGVMDKPMFATPEDHPTAPPNKQSEAVGELARGNYDSLFAGAPHKVSAVYAQSQKNISPIITVELARTTPLRPDKFELPKYPPIAKAAQIDGTVEYMARVGTDGKLLDLTLLRGHPMLAPAVKEAAEKWVYPFSATNQTVSFVVQFQLNCPAKSDNAR